MSRPHLTRERPNPDTAPYWLAIVVLKQYPAKSPIQFNKKETTKKRQHYNTREKYFSSAGPRDESDSVTASSRERSIS